MDSNEEEIFKLFDDLFDVSTEILFDVFKTYMGFFLNFFVHILCHKIR